MSGTLCCYTQQQHSKLLAQFVFNVSTLCFNTHTKMRAPQPDCHINNALFQFIPSCHFVRIRERNLWTSLIRPLVTFHASLSHCLVVRIFIPKNSIVTTFFHLALVGSVIEFANRGAIHSDTESVASDDISACSIHRQNVSRVTERNILTLLTRISHSPETVAHVMNAGTICGLLDYAVLASDLLPAAGRTLLRLSHSCHASPCSTTTVAYYYL